MINCKILTLEEQSQALMLLSRCFPVCWEHIAIKYGKFPFEEISFAAIEEQAGLVGHVGLMLHEVSDGKGHSLGMAGLASVAVAPEFRGRAISTTLCNLAKEWSIARGDIASLPLYTGLDRVYQRCGWQNYTSYAPRMVDFSNAQTKPLPDFKIAECGELDLPERRQIMQLYADGEDFPGKVLRKTEGMRFHCWKHIWEDNEFTCAWGKGIYALLSHDLECLEAYFAASVTDADIVAFLASIAARTNNRYLHISQWQSSRLWTALERKGLKMSISNRDFMHGEHPMFQDIGTANYHTAIRPFYPLVDKF